MVDYISKIIFGKGLDKNDGSCDNLSQPASQPASQLSITLPFFPVKLKLQIFKAYSARLTMGGMRLFLFCGKNL